MGFLLAKSLILQEWVSRDSLQIGIWLADLRNQLYREKLKAELNRDTLTDEEMSVL